MIKIGYAVTGSFCTFSKTLVVMQALVDKGYELVPIFSYNTCNLDTRFYKAKDFYSETVRITGKYPICDLVNAEPLGTKEKLDLIVVCPCTGKTRKRHNGHSRNACGQGASQKLPSRAYRAVEQRRAGRERKKSRSSSEHEERILCTDGTGRARHKNEIAHRRFFNRPRRGETCTERKTSRTRVQEFINVIDNTRAR